MPTTRGRHRSAIASMNPSTRWKLARTRSTASTQSIPSDARPRTAAAVQSAPSRWEMARSTPITTSRPGGGRRCGPTRAARGRRRRTQTRAELPPKHDARHRRAGGFDPAGSRWGLVSDGKRQDATSFAGPLAVEEQAVEPAAHAGAGDEQRAPAAVCQRRPQGLGPDDLVDEVGLVHDQQVEAFAAQRVGVVGALAPHPPPPGSRIACSLSGSRRRGSAGPAARAGATR